MRNQKEKRKPQSVIQNIALDLYPIKPITKNQNRAFNAYYDDFHLFLHGCAGTGKSFLALYLALEQMFEEPDVPRKIIIVRSAVPSRDIGFLPGNVKEKSKEFETPYQAICNDLFKRGDAYQILKTKGALEFLTTSYVRGITLNNTILILEEVQNFTYAEAFSVLTRVGKNCRVIVTGDFRQSDLKMGSGIFKLMRIVKRMSDFKFVEFDTADIVRSGFVKDFILASLEEEDEDECKNSLTTISLPKSILKGKTPIVVASTSPQKLNGTHPSPLS